MTHRECLERLPWWLSGTLEPDERRAVELHLETCAECRTELARTRAVAALHAAAHPSAAQLVALAWESPDLAGRDEIERHVAECPDCSEELALARVSRGLESPAAGGEIVPFAPAGAPRRPARWPFALAATLAAAALAWGLVEARRGESARAEAAGLAERLRGAEREAELVASVRAAGERESRRVRELEREIARRSGPQAGLLLVEMLPELTLRGAGAAPPVAIVRPAGTSVALLLGLERAEAYPSYTVRARAAGGAELWRLEGLRADERGALGLLLPAESLPSASVRFEVEGERGAARSPVAAYRLVIRAAPGANGPDAAP